MHTWLVASCKLFMVARYESSSFFKLSSCDFPPPPVLFWNRAHRASRASWEWKESTGSWSPHPGALWERRTLCQWRRAPATAQRLTLNGEWTYHQGISGLWVWISRLLHEEDKLYPISSIVDLNLSKVLNAQLQLKSDINFPLLHVFRLSPCVSLHMQHLHCILVCFLVRFQ